MKNLLTKSLIAAAMIPALYGCGGSSEGFDYGYNGEEPVTFTNEVLAKEFTEGTGVQVIDMLEGAINNGTELTGEDKSVFIRDYQFLNPGEHLYPPELENPDSNKPITAFYVEGNFLHIRTDNFVEDLQLGGAIPEVTYRISYLVENGAELAEGEELEPRIVEVTVKAVADPVTGITGQPLTAVVGAPKKAQISVLPHYAVDQDIIGWTIADESVAVVDDEGFVTGNTIGETTLTAKTAAKGPQEGSDLEDHYETTIKVTVIDPPVGATGLTVANAGFDNDGVNVAPETIELPSCRIAGLKAMPSGDNLSGQFSYNWVSETESAAQWLNTVSGSIGYTGFGAFQMGTDVSEATKVSVALDGTDYTDDIQVALRYNRSCEAKGGETFDPRFDTAKTSHWKILNQNTDPDFPNTLSLVNDSISGTALQFVCNAKNLNCSNADYWQGFDHQNWASGNVSNSFFGKYYGLPRDWNDSNPGSHGMILKASVWAKIVRVDQSDMSPVTLNHTLLPWLAVDNRGNRQETRQLGPNFTGQIVPGDWQYIELVDTQTFDDVAGSPEGSFTIPTSWKNKQSGAATSVVPEFIFIGLKPGDKVILDEYSMMELQE